MHCQDSNGDCLETGIESINFFHNVLLKGLFLWKKSPKFEKNNK